MVDTCVSLNRGVEHELSLIWGPVQNQILQFRVCSYAGRLGHSALLAKAYQGNTLDIGLDTFPSLVSISQVGECITKTLQKPPSSRHARTRVPSNPPNPQDIRNQFSFLFL